ncbi:MAG: Cdc6/Cdc18 family protein [Promethearchaeota archaeon]
MDFEDELLNSLRSDLIFKANGEGTFERTFIPPKIIDREEELRKLIMDFKIIFKEDKGVNVAISGGGGFGKTLICRYAQDKFAKVAADLGINFDSRYYTCYQYRTLGAILRDYLPKNLYISGKGFSISELISYLADNLRKQEKKLLLVIDEVQNLKPIEIMQILTINEDTKKPSDNREFLSSILIARDYDWQIILDKMPRIAQRLDGTIKLAKYDLDLLIEIFKYRRDLAFRENALSDENVQLVAEMAKSSGNVYYGLEIMHHAGKLAQHEQINEILPEMLRKAAKYVSTEFREPVLQDLTDHELLTLLAIARVLERKSKQNINYCTSQEAYDEYCITCEEYLQKNNKPRVITVFRKYLNQLSKTKLIHEKVKSLPTRGRRGEITIVDFPAELVIEKVLNILEERNKSS